MSGRDLRHPTENCAVCKVDLAPRLVPRQVKRPGRVNLQFAGGISMNVEREITFTKRVKMKPAQVLIGVLRVEGSIDKDKLPPVATWSLRVCAACLAGRTFGEVLAVVLDRRLETGG